MFDCPCAARRRLCDDCVKDGFAQLRGVAARRGEEFVEGIKTRPPSWPESSLAVLAVLRIKVADLHWDARLREELALEAARYAAKRFAEFAVPARHASR